MPGPDRSTWLATKVGEPPLKLSTIIPVYNEKESLELLYRDLSKVLQRITSSYEILFIDDGSIDGSNQILIDIARADDHVKILELTRNFGQTAAISAGFDHAKGAIIIPLDADLQNDPCDIPKILEKLNEGYDVVSCWRKNRQDPWLTRVLPSHLANRLISWVSGVRLQDYGCTLKGYRSEIIQHIRLYGEMHRFIPVFASWAGARVAEIPVQHHPRKHGRSKYGLLRTLKVVLDLITVKFLVAYSTKPMYLFGGLGLISILFGWILCGLTLYQKIFEQVKVHRNPLFLLCVFLFIVGLQFVFFGLIAELITRTYYESQGKPIYILNRRRQNVLDTKSK